MEKEYFENQSNQWIIGEVQKYFNHYHTVPTMEVLSTEVKKIDNDVLKIAITEALRESYKESQASDLEWVEAEFTSFCKNQQMKKAIMTSVDLLNMGDYDGIRSLINGALKSGEDKNIGHEYDKDVESRYREDDRNILHVFARTKNQPHQYYYRRQEDGFRWTPWEAIDLDIEGDHLIPVIFNRRPMLFWPVINEIPSIPNEVKEADVGKKTSTFLEIKMAFSEWRNNKWQQKRKT